MKFRYFLQQLLIAAPLTVLAATGAHAEDAGTIMPDKLLVGVAADQKLVRYDRADVFRARAGCSKQDQRSRDQELLKKVAKFHDMRRSIK